MALPALLAPHALLARCRLALARRPWITWVAVAACAIVMWTAVTGAQADARRAARSWGRTRLVWVSTADTTGGSSMHAVARQFPIAMVPPTAVTREPTGPAARPVSAGAVVVRADLAGPVSPPVGWVVFALPADGAPHLQPGDRVAVFGGGQLLGTGISAGLSPAAPGGTVEVAVDPVWAAAVAQQLAAHTIAIAREVPAGT